MDRVEFFIYRDGGWERVISLSTVRRGVPELLNALSTLRDWCPYDTRVVIDFRSKREEVTDSD